MGLQDVCKRTRDLFLQPFPEINKTFMLKKSSVFICDLNLIRR